jgi:type 1 fimbriae regulatory protein FimE
MPACIRYRPVRAEHKLLREAPASPYVFISERRAPLSAAGYQRMVARAGVAAKFTFPVHTQSVQELLERLTFPLVALVLAVT